MTAKINTNFKNTSVEVTYKINGEVHVGRYTISADTLNHSARILSTTDFGKALDYAVHFIFIDEDDDDGEIINITIK